MSFLSPLLDAAHSFSFSSSSLSTMAHVLLACSAWYTMEIMLTDNRGHNAPQEMTMSSSCSAPFCALVVSTPTASSVMHGHTHGAVSSSCCRICPLARRLSLKHQGRMPIVAHLFERLYSTCGMLLTFLPYSALLATVGQFYLVLFLIDRV